MIYIAIFSFKISFFDKKDCNFIFVAN